MAKRALGWLLWLLCLPVLAQAGVPEIPRFRLVSAADGLPSTTITALARDRSGYLWMATWDGLARYDGVGFRVWRHDPGDPASLPGNVVQALHIDADDRIWVATENGGMSVMEPGRKGFRHYRMASHPQMGSDDVFAIASRGSDLWFGTFGGGLHRLSADGRITRFAAGAAGAGLPSDNVLALAFDARGMLWIGTMGGLARFDGRSVQREPLPSGDSLIVYSVTPDAGTLWVGAADGVHRRLADGRWVAPAWSAMFGRPNALIAMTSDGHGEYWLAAQGGLWRTEGDRAPAPVNYDAQGVGIGRVLQTVLALPDGGLWVPVPTRGLAYLRSDWRRIAAFSSAQGLGGGLYRGLAAADEQGLWLASSTGKVERLDTRTGQVVPLPHHATEFSQLRMTSVLQDRSGQLWLGHRNGLIRTDPQTGAMVQWGQGGDEPVPDKTSVEWLAEAPDGSLWLVTQLGSVQRRDVASGRILDTIAKDSEAGQALPDIEGIAVAPDGMPWLATAAGMLRWDAAARRFAPVPEFGGDRIYAFTFEHADRLWLHRMSGVEAWRREGARWVNERRIGAAEGLPALESTGLAVDPQRRVWLGTRRGLFRIDPNLRGSDASLRNFGVREGLLSQELNERGLFMTRDGLLASSAADGSVALLDTGLPDPRPLVPNLVLDTLQVSRGDDTMYAPAAEGLTLQPSDHELIVSTRLLSYENPLGNRYRSMLEGFDTTWVDQGTSGERVFSTLAPGRYRLRVQAHDAAGNPSRELVLPFRVLPPWWRSPWGLAMFALLGVLALVAAGAAYRRRVRRRTAWQLAEHKRELAEQASLAKTRFLATLGHEIRTPMTGVLGMTELLQATPLDARQQGYADAIQRAGTHLLRLVNDALDLAKIEAGKLELQQVDFDLHALVEDVGALMGPVAGKRGLRFQLRIAPDLPRSVNGDPLRLRQILLNLLGNGIKFTEAGSVSLHASALPGGGVLLDVADTGPGINAEQQARLFRRFEQAEGANTTARYGGSGLGLAICQELAVAMGGRIRVDSAPGQGTRFHVELPTLGAAPWPSTAPAAGPAVLPATVPPCDVLLVEDDATVAEVVAGLLRARGHRVVHVPHGLAALAEVADKAFDLAFLDLDLPGLDGMALAQHLRQRGITAPLVALTARADAEAEPMARAAGFDEFVRKPVTGDMLAEVMVRVLAARRAGEAEAAAVPDAEAAP